MTDDKSAAPEAPEPELIPPPAVVLQHYGVLDAAGLPIAWYNNEIFPDQTDGSRNAAIPVDAVKVSADDWHECIANPGVRKVVDGKAVSYEPPPLPPIVPETVSERQFMQQLAMDGKITWDECFAYLGQGVIPTMFGDAIAKLPEPYQNPAKAAFIGANSFDRHNPTVIALGKLIGMSDAALDELWTAAFALK